MFGVLRGLACAAIDAVAPRCCAGCGRPDPRPLCRVCRLRAEALPQPPHLVRRGRHTWAAFPFEEPVDAVVTAAKYCRHRAGLIALGEFAARRLERSGCPRPDLVVAVPLGRRRYRERGFNQADIVAQAFADTLRMPIAAGLVRHRETSPQTGTRADRRRVNARGAFSWVGASLSGRRVWLADDVETTGSTLDAAADALDRAGATTIDRLTLARAGHHGIGGGDEQGAGI